MTDKPKKKIWSRRDFLMQSGGGMAGLALASLMNDDKAFAQDAALSGGQCSAVSLVRSNQSTHTSSRELRA